MALATAFAVAGCGGNSSNPIAPAPGVPYSQTDLVVGTGPAVVAGNKVTIDYTVWLYDPNSANHEGTLIGTSVGTGQPYPFTVGDGTSIAGVDQGVRGMQVGGSRRLVLPPNLAYGNQGFNAIPPNATLTFEITLLAIQ